MTAYDDCRVQNIVTGKGRKTHIQRGFLRKIKTNNITTKIEAMSVLYLCRNKIIFVNDFSYNGRADLGDRVLAQVQDTQCISVQWHSTPDRTQNHQMDYIQKNITVLMYKVHHIPTISVNCRETTLFHNNRSTILLVFIIIISEMILISIVLLILVMYVLVTYNWSTNVLDCTRLPLSLTGNNRNGIKGMEHKRVVDIASRIRECGF